MFCREQAASLDASLDRIRAAGGDLALIGNGTAEMARDFVEQFHLRVPVYTDPSRRTFLAAGLRSDVVGVMHPRMAAAALRAMRAGARQGATQGHVQQLGGALVITPDERVVYQQASVFAGDHADPADLLRAVQAAVAAPAVAAVP